MTQEHLICLIKLSSEGQPAKSVAYVQEKVKQDDSLCVLIRTGSLELVNKAGLSVGAKRSSRKVGGSTILDENNLS